MLSKQEIFKRTQIDKINLYDICKCTKPKILRQLHYSRVNQCVCGCFISSYALAQFPIKTRYQFINENH